MKFFAKKIVADKIEIRLLGYKVVSYKRKPTFEERVASAVKEQNQQIQTLIEAKGNEMHERLSEAFSNVHESINDSFEDARQLINDKATFANEENKKLQAKMDALQGATADLVKSECSGVRDENKKLQAKMDALQGATADLVKSECSGVRDENKKLQAKMDALQGATANLVKSECSGVRDENKKLQAALEILRSELLKIQGEVKRQTQQTSNYKIIATSKYFDAAWYSKKYLANCKEAVDPVQHYLDVGWREGNNPSCIFNASEYLDANPDVRKAGINPLIHYVKSGLSEGREVSKTHAGVPFRVQYAKPAIAFSVIMPTYNRASMITAAIDSLLKQTYQNFELIVVDDGSTDETETLIAKSYPDELKNEKIRYFYIENGGPGRARNYALSRARNEWIAYLDSDNQLYPFYLQTYADAIRSGDNELFYATWDYTSGRMSPSRPFDRYKLLKGNYIDVGVFVHSKKFFDVLGGFNERLKMLEDWELILRYTKKTAPCYIQKSVFLYDDGNDRARITTDEAFEVNRDLVWEIHRPKMSVVIPVYDVSPDNIRRALKKILNQTLTQVEFVFVDDCCTTGAMDVVYDVSKADDRIRIIKNESHAGFEISYKNGMLVSTGIHVTSFDFNEECDSSFCERSIIK